MNERTIITLCFVSECRLKKIKFVNFFKAYIIHTNCTLIQFTHIETIGIETKTFYNIYQANIHYIKNINNIYFLDKYYNCRYQYHHYSKRSFR